MNRSTRRRFIQQTTAISSGLAIVPSVWSCASDGTAISLDAFARLRSKLKGSLVLPNDSQYDAARRVFYWNPRTERTPVAVVQCGHEEDVVRAVEFARQHALEVAVRSGGHSHLAWGSSHGLVIDVSPLKQVTIDPSQRIVRAQAGVLGSELSRAADTFGLVPVLGQCPGVGATGVILGGGLGWLAGRFGACCDNLLSARIVTADARLLDVNEKSDPDLLWALRGAGANFGVTVSFEAKLQSIGLVTGGDIHYAVRDARVVMRGFRDIMHAAPDGFQATLNLTPGDRGLFINFCHSGTEQEANRMVQSMKAIAKPMKEIVQRHPFVKIAEKAAATNPGNTPVATFRAIQTVYRERITDEIIETCADLLERATPDVIMGFSHYMHGQVCRISPTATAFPYRQEHAVHLRVAYNWSDPKESERRFAWGEQWLQRLRSQTDERIYANYQTYETKAGSPSIFGPNHARLLALKNKHDPTNFFRRNANIAPSRA